MTHHRLPPWGPSSRYELQEKLAAGGQSQAYLALDRLLDRKVVIKEVARAHSGSLRQEFEVLRQLRHPNLVQVCDLFAVEERLFLVQTHAPGPEFGEWAARDRSPARISLGVAATLRALQYIHHRGAVHRDVKPANLRVDDRPIGALPGVRVVDFGLASFDPPAEVAGTRGFMAPEVMAGAQATPAADIYSLGIVLLEALTGRPHDPTRPAPLGELLLASPYASLLVELLRALLESEPQRRPTAAAALEALGCLVGHDLQISLAELATDYFPQPTLIGREDHLHQLELTLAEVKGGAGRLVQLVGAGKDELAAETCARAQLAGLRVVLVHSPAILLRLARVGVMRQPVGGSGQDSDDPKELAGRIVDALAGTDRPSLLLCVDGGVLREPVVAAVVRQLALLVGEGGCQRLAVLVTGQLRPEVCGESAAPWDRIQLPELSVAQVDRLVRGMLYHLPAIPWLEQVHAVTGGDPRRVVELVRAQIEAGLPDRIVVPPELDAWAGHRVATLDPQPRELLAVLAHAPAPVPPAVLAEMSLATGGPSVGALGHLLSRGLVLLGPTGIAPSNALIRRVAGSALSGEALRALHARYAEAWQAGEEADPAIVGHHLLLSDQLDPAATLLLRAKAPAEEDLRLLVDRLAPDSTAWLPVVCRLARVTRAAGRLEEALELAERLLPRAREQGILLQAELLLDAGNPSRALEALRQLRMTSEAGMVMSARAHVLLGEFSEAAAQAAEGLAVETLSAPRRIQLQNVLGLSEVYLGRATQGLEVLRAAEAEARRLDERGILARVLNSVGIALQRQGQIDAAAASYRECLRLFEETGDLGLAATCALNLGTLAHRRMLFGEALLNYRKAGALGQRWALTTTSGWAMANESNLLLQLGQTEEAGARLETARTLARREGGRSLVGHVLLYQAEVQRARGHLAEAARSLREAVDAFEPSDRPGQDAAQALACELLLQRGDWVAAKKSSLDLLATVAAEDPDRARALLLAGKVALAANPPQLTEGVEQLLAAARCTEATVGFDRTWEIHALLADALDRLGQPDQAAQHRAHFAGSLDRLRQAIPPQFRNGFEARDDVRAARELAAGGVAVAAPTIPPGAGMLRLLEINQELNEGLPLERLLERILDGAIELAGAERGGILVRNGDRLRLTAARNADREPLRRGAAKFSRSIAMRVLQDQRPALIRDAAVDERFHQQLSVSALRLRAVLCVPLRTRREQIGVLYLDNRFGVGVFDEGTVALAIAFADQAGIALENARLLGEAIAQREKLATAKAEVEELNRRLMAQGARQSQELSEISVRLRHQEEDLVRRYNAAQLIGRSKSMIDVFVQIDRVAEADVPVVIQGESGTGKELVARAIHQAGPRAEQPFVAVNCAAIPAGLLESELFGCAKGAFTGADRDRPGLIDVARGGTLFLDEVGDMNLEMQVKLLRVLQEGTFRRLGDRAERRSQCRVLAASHKELDQLVRSGAFREDLFYRLNVIRIHVPALRERREDIPLLVAHLLEGEKRTLQVAPAAMRALVDYAWPGNVRQLANELKRASLLGEDVITFASLSAEVRGGGTPSRDPSDEGLRESLRDYERRLIQTALEQTDFNVSRAAGRLKINRVVLHRRIAALGLSRPQRGKRV